MQNNKQDSETSNKHQHSTGEFTQEDIGEFHPSNCNSQIRSQQNSKNNQQNIEYQQNNNNFNNNSEKKNKSSNFQEINDIKNQNNINNNDNNNNEINKQNSQFRQNYQDQFSESLEDIEILDEYEKVDGNKKLPRVNAYKTISNSNLGRVIDFVSYQFPEIFLYKNSDQIREKLENSRSQIGTLRRKQKKNQNQEKKNQELNEDNEEEDEDDDDQEQDYEAEQKVIVDVVENLLILASPRNKEDQEMSPKTEKYIKIISRELDKEGEEYFQKQLSKKQLDSQKEEQEEAQEIFYQQNRNQEQTSILEENQGDKEYQQELNNKFQKNDENQNQSKFQNQNFLEFLKQKYYQWEKQLPKTVELTKDVIFLYQKDEITYSTMDKQQLDEYQKNLALKRIEYDPKDKKQKDKDPRHIAAFKEGGKKCMDQKMIQLLRDTGTYMIKKIGRQLISGDFDLTKLSFPIKVMIPMSGLEKAINSTCLFPVYVTKAAKIKNDPVERLKLVITASLGHFFINLSFLKPLNPILGETIEAEYPDGTKLYGEQISHHPPVTYFSCYGPENCYRFNGYYNFKSNAGLNSLTLKNSGSRCIRFQDGQVIEYNFGKEKYTGSFWGTMRTECEGKVTFQDKKNGLQAIIEFGNVKSRPNDYFQGCIQKMESEQLNDLTSKNANKNKKIGEKISEIYGSYMGFIDFDGARYWDIHSTTAFKPQILVSGLESDQMYRPDKAHLQRGHVEQAQKEKEGLEVLQRKDAALRKQFDKDQIKQAKLLKKEEKKKNKK